MMTDFLTDTKTSSIVCWYCYPALLQYVAISVIWLLPHNAMLVQYVLWLCVCLSVCLSVTSQSFMTTIRHVIMQPTPHGSLGTLVFWFQTSCWNSCGVTPIGGGKYALGGKNLQLSTSNLLYLQNNTR